MLKFGMNEFTRAWSTIHLHEARSQEKREIRIHSFPFRFDTKVLSRAIVLFADNVFSGEHFRHLACQPRVEPLFSLLIMSSQESIFDTLLVNLESSHCSLC